MGLVHINLSAVVLTMCINTSGRTCPGRPRDIASSVLILALIRNMPDGFAAVTQDADILASC
jgi:hypothetical protein